MFFFGLLNKTLLRCSLKLISNGVLANGDERQFSRYPQVELRAAVSTSWFTTIKSFDYTMPSLVKVVADSYSLEIPETALLMENGVELTSEMRPITQIEGLEWCIEYSPAGYLQKDAGFVSVFVHVTKPVGIRFVFAVKNTAVKFRDRVLIEDDEELSQGKTDFVSHDELRKNGAIQNGKFVITCDVEFEVPLAKHRAPLPIQNLLLETCPQVTFVVGKDTVTMNKAILTSISPVFHAMFNHDTKEARTSMVKITDFDVETIQNVKSLCLGIEINLTSNESIQMLKFADKYDIKGLQKYLESFLAKNITDNNFCDIADYAWKHSRDIVKINCARYFSKHGDGIYLTSAFAGLEPTIMASLVKAAVDWKSK